MISNTCNNPQQLKDLILSRLGAPIIPVEVTEDQIYHSIEQAIELYGQYHYDGVRKSFITISGYNDDSRQYTFDLSNYPVFAVTNVLRSDSASNWTMDGNTTYAWVTDFLNGLTTGANTGGVHYYSPLSGAGDLSTYSMLMSYTKLMQDLLTPIPIWDFDNGSKLFNVPDGLGKGEALMLEVYIATYVDRSDAELSVGNANIGVTDSLASSNDVWNNPNNQFQSIGVSENTDLDQRNVYNNRWVKDYSTQLVKYINGVVLSKNQGMNLPGGIQIDGRTMMQESKDELDKMKEELYELQAPSPIMMG